MDVVRSLGVLVVFAVAAVVVVVVAAAAALGIDRLPVFLQFEPFSADNIWR